MKIRPSIILACLLAVGASGWILSGQIGSGDGEAPNGTANARLSDPETGSDVETNTPAKAELTVRVRRSEAVPHHAIMVMTGRTAADRRVTISAETDGRVEALSVDKSDIVTDGQKLAEIATDERYAALNEAKALVKQREIEADAAHKLAQKGFQSTTKKAEADANLSAAKAQLERVRIDLTKTTVEAPFAASVERKAVETGDFVQRGDPILHLIDLDPLNVTVHVSERDIADVRVGAVADIRLVSGEEIQGTVATIATTAEAQTRTFEVELEVPNPDGALRDGITAQVRLPSREVLAHRISPAWLTLDDLGRVGVKSVDADGSVRFLPVEIVEDFATGMYVAGLGRVEDIITVGQDFVKEGTRVSVAYEGEAVDAPQREKTKPDDVVPESLNLSVGDRS